MGIEMGNTNSPFGKKRVVNNFEDVAPQEIVIDECVSGTSKVVLASSSGVGTIGVSNLEYDIDTCYLSGIKIANADSAESATCATNATCAINADCATNATCAESATCATNAECASEATNATCFNGCTYAAAKADILSNIVTNEELNNGITLTKIGPLYIYNFPDGTLRCDAFEAIDCCLSDKLTTQIIPILATSNTEGSNGNSYISKYNANEYAIYDYEGTTHNCAQRFSACNFNSPAYSFALLVAGSNI